MNSTIIGLFSIFYLVVFNQQDGEVKGYKKYVDKAFCERAMAKYTQRPDLLSDAMRSPISRTKWGKLIAENENRQEPNVGLRCVKGPVM